MDKLYSYEIFYDNYSNNKCFDYLFYIVIFFLLAILVLRLYKENDTNSNKYYIDNFQSLSSSIDRDAYCNQIDKTLEFYKKENIQLKKKLNEIEMENLLSKDYVKYSDQYSNEYKIFSPDFELEGIPSTVFNSIGKNKVIINNQSDFDKVIYETKNFKNVYKPGEIVNSPSSLNISAKDICYSDVKDPKLKSKNLDCMVCSVNQTNFTSPDDPSAPNNGYLNSEAYKKTKTNINKVCLFKNNSDDPTILNYNQCKTFCKV